MTHQDTSATQTTGRLPSGDILRALLPVATHGVIAQLDAFTARLSNALLALSEQSMDSRVANLSFTAGQLLKKNAYAFFHLASQEIEKSLRNDIEALLLDQRVRQPSAREEADFSLISYEDMDKTLALSRVSRSVELDNAESYAALNMRLSHLLQRETLSIAQNPFRPDVFLSALHLAWCQFDPEPHSHELIVPLLRPDILFDLGPLLYELNQTLIGHGVLTDLQESYRIRRHREKAHTVLRSGDLSEESPAAAKLKKFLSAGSAESATQDRPMPQTIQGETGQHTHAAESQLFQQLATYQKSLRLQQIMSESGDIWRLSQMPEQVSAIAATGAEKQTLNLLSQVFDNVFQNAAIPAPVKQLIAILQIPVLKAALIDKDFFFKEQHPARRLIDVLSRYSLALDQAKGTTDPLYQKMQHNVERVSQEFDQEIALFDEVIQDLEAFIQQQEQASAASLQVPIQKAIRKEKIKQASVTANHEVALRTGSGEVVAFIETFLEHRWVKVLTLAYSVKDEKPHALEDAIRTMDDLIWSVKPKVTLPERQELLNRLPAILARLNKWLTLIKWEDADRIQFFAELAECHASIVRAPLELSPERQLEIAVEAAQQAAERRLEKRAQAEQQAKQELVPEDEYVHLVDQLERGIWIEMQDDASGAQKLRLAWVSPMRSLYIFTSSQKEHSFSISAKKLQQMFREQRASILNLDKVVDQALMLAINGLPEESPQTDEHPA